MPYVSKEGIIYVLRKYNPLDLFLLSVAIAAKKDLFLYVEVINKDQSTYNLLIKKS